MDKSRQYYVDARINPSMALISWLIVWIIRKNLTKDLLDGVPWSS